jgi:hypothetical protein
VEQGAALSCCTRPDLQSEPLHPRRLQTRSPRPTRMRCPRTVGPGVHICRLDALYTACHRPAYEPHVEVFPQGDETASTRRRRASKRSRGALLRPRSPRPRPTGRTGEAGQPLNALSHEGACSSAVSAVNFDRNTTEMGSLPSKPCSQPPPRLARRQLVPRTCGSARWIQSRADRWRAWGRARRPSPRFPRWTGAPGHGRRSVPQHAHVAGGTTAVLL